MNSFLFVTHLTPENKSSSIRKSLFNLHEKAIFNQTYSNWKVFQVGEEEFRDEKIFRVRLDNSKSKDEQKKLLYEIFSREDVKEYFEKSDYIIKLDDDDVISPILLEHLADFNLDLYCDEFHFFYDLCTGMISSQKRNWIASTCVHRTEHALTKVNPSGPPNIFFNSLLYTNHSITWHEFYKNKNYLTASAHHPVYMRVLSPTSISSGVRSNLLLSSDDIDFICYGNYLRGFGSWVHFSKNDFSCYQEELIRIWENFPKGRNRMNINLQEKLGLANRLRKLFKF